MYHLLQRSAPSLSSPTELLVWARKRPHIPFHMGDHLDLSFIPCNQTTTTSIGYPNRGYSIHTLASSGEEDRASNVCCKSPELLRGIRPWEPSSRFGRVFFSTRRGRGEERERRSGERGNYLSTQEDRSNYRRSGGPDIAFHRSI
jgi:hypothetical protein